MSRTSIDAVRPVSTTSHVEADSPWGAELDRVVQQIGPRFARSEARQRVRAYLLGLLSPVPRKNSWQLAEQLGNATPYGVQHLLGRAEWDPNAVRDDLDDYVVAGLGDPDAVLVLDEVALPKKGTHSAGVAEQRVGSNGRVENCQIGVFLAYRSRLGTALIDRALYLPRSWTEDRERRGKVGIPDEVRFQTKPRLGRHMLEDAIARQVPSRWVCGGEVFGSDTHLRRWLEKQERPYALAVATDRSVTVDGQQESLTDLAASLPKRAWQSASRRSEDPDAPQDAWAWQPIDGDSGPAWQRWVLIRRRAETPDQLEFVLAFGPKRTTRAQLTEVLDARMAMDRAIEEARRAVGLFDYEVRSWTGWYRHVTLALLAHAILVLSRKARPKRNGTKRPGRSRRGGSVRHDHA